MTALEVSVASIRSFLPAAAIFLETSGMALGWLACGRSLGWPCYRTVTTPAGLMGKTPDLGVFSLGEKSTVGILTR